MKQLLSLLCVTVIVLSCTHSKTNKAELVLDTKSELGEGALWNHKTGQLMWINIEGKILNIYNPESGFNREMLTGQKIGTVVPTESGHALVALKKGIYHFNLETGSKKLLAAPEAAIENNRFNDGKCDPSGRFWAGTMSMIGEKETGTLYRFDADSSIHAIIPNVSISNGIVWSLDNKKMYYIDTPTQKVMGYDFDVETGNITNPKVAVKVPEEMGSPDGMTIDENGNIWVALWGGSAVACWNPETGALLQTIKVPAKNVTSCAFGDDDLGTLYITSARTATSEEELLQYPHAGGLFKVQPGVKGVKAFFFNDQP